MSVIIKPATADDVSSLAQFNREMALETEELVLDPSVVLSGVTRLLQRPDQGLYFIAWAGQERAGSAMITYEWSDWRDGYFWWIQSVFIQPSHRRKGLFSAIYQHISNLAEHEPDCRGLRLYVEKDNLNAQATYSALGMQQTHYRLFEQLFD